MAMFQTLWLIIIEVLNWFVSSFEGAQVDYVPNCGSHKRSPLQIRPLMYGLSGEILIHAAIFI
jgi:putative component of membrane protein insertase Oxa1/YidC/SpoIIIJ protein YidD